MPKQYKIKNLKRNKFSLILSGGSSLGLAHIGTMEFLEDNNLTPSEIIGTSMGSIVGALYAVGNTSEIIRAKIKDLKTQDLFEIKYLQGRVERTKGKTLLKDLFQDAKMKDTKIPLKIIATKLKNGEIKVFTEEDDIKIYDAILASAAIPGIFPAREIKNEIYIDGCVSSNLPLEVAKKKNIKLAINVINKKIENYKYTNPEKSLIKNLKTKYAILKRSSRYYIINQTETKIRQTKKLILIEPNLKGFNSYKITDHEKIIKAGYLETKKYFDKAKKSKEKKKRRETSLERIIKFPITSTRKIIKNIQKLQ